MVSKRFNIDIYLNKEVSDSINLLPNSLRKQICLHFLISQNDKRAFEKMFKPVENLDVRKGSALKQLNFHFQGKLHRILGYNHKANNKMALLSYEVAKIGQEIKIDQIKALREKAYSFAKAIDKKKKTKENTPQRIKTSTSNSL